MKFVTLLIIACAAVFFGYPLVNEDTGGECDAFERMVLRAVLSAENQRSQVGDVMLGQFAQGFSKGEIARVTVRNDYPNVPVSVGCAMLYWRATIDPKGRPKSAAAEAQQRMEQARDAAGTIRAPAPKPTGAEAGKGYTADQMRDMNRLLQQNTQ